MLKRLTSATATTNSSSYYPAWSEQFAYDGFGNLTSKTMNGTQQSIAVNSPTNQLSSAAYDANGNMLTGSGATLTYNEDNRMSSATVTGGGMEYYYYTPDGKRFWRQMTDGSIRFTLWGAQGEQLGVYYGDDAPISPQTMSVFFSGRLIYQGQTHYGTGYGPQPYQYGNVPGFVLPDRLGSNDSGGMMYPYGETPGVAGQDQVEFATYNRDSYTGFDNAVNRVYNSFAGRFNTADPYKASAGPSDPGTWNRYSYTAGDPVNRRDPSGLLFQDPGSYASYEDCISNAFYGSGDCPINDDDDGATWALACQDLLPNPACYSRTYAVPPGAGNGGSSAPPTCSGVLLSEVQLFLQQDDPKLLAWDPDLASQFVATGATDGVDPRLMASIATLESGHGGAFGGTNNPFGLGPKLNFDAPLAAVRSLGRTLMHLIGYGDNTVTKLYSGLPGISDSHRGYSQVPGYCQTSVSKCVAAGVTVSGFLSSFAASPGVGLTAGNPNNLKFPCP